MAYSTLVATELSPGLIEAGAKLVTELDAANIDIPAAFWLLSDEEDRGWRLILASAHVQQFGTLSFYNKISPVLTSTPPLTLSYISGVKPDDSMVSLLRRALKTGGGISSIRFTRNVINGILIPDAYIYRL